MNKLNDLAFSLLLFVIYKGGFYETIRAWLYLFCFL